MSLALQSALRDRAGAVTDILSRFLPATEDPESRLFEAMRYSALAGGKRLRPFLVLTVADMFHVSENAALRVAAAVEMVHTYSLIHDDLPSMDDDDLRRGEPACHRRFDEATAILAGDGLQARAFEILAQDATHADPAVRCALIGELAQAAGPHGMVGGQMIDLLTARAGPTRDALTVTAITRMHQMKAGRMIAFSCLAGAMLAKAAARLKQSLRAYANDLGLAFQIIDDVLDVEGDPGSMGKSRGKDALSGKVTYVTLLGLEQAKDQARRLGEQAIEHLRAFDCEADLLRDVARYVLDRDH